MATVRSSRVSRARYTSPMPPVPAGAMISYGPSFVPATSVITAPTSYFLCNSLAKLSPRVHTQTEVANEFYRQSPVRYLFGAAKTASTTAHFPGALFSPLSPCFLLTHSKIPSTVVRSCRAQPSFSGQEHYKHG